MTNTHATADGSDADRSGAGRSGPIERLVARLFAQAGEHELAAALAASTVFALRLGGAAVAYVTQIYIARVLGVEEYGRFALIWVWIMVLGHLTPMGFAQTIIRFVPHYLAIDRPGHLKGYLGVGLAFILAASIGFSLAGIGGVTALSGAIDRDFVMPIAIALAVLPFFGLQEFLENVARSFNWPVRAILPPYLIRHTLIGVFVFVFSAYGYAMDAGMALLATLGATASVAAIQTALIAPKVLPAILARRADYCDRRLWFRTAFPLWFVDGTHMFLANIDVIILGFVASTAEVAIYFAATRLQQLVGLISYAVTAATAQRYSALNAHKRLAELHRLALYSTRASFAVSALAAASILAVSPILLSLFGSDFSSGAPVLAILMAGHLAQTAAGPGEDLLNMLGHEKVCASVFLGSFVFSAALCLALAIPFGIYGAAAAVAVSTGLRGWLLAGQAKRCLGLSIHLGGRLTGKTETLAERT